MKVAATALLLLILLVSHAQGQAGYIGLYSDAVGTNCAAVDTTQNGILFVYVFHKATPGAKYSQFMVQQNAGADLT